MNSQNLSLIVENDMLDYEIIAEDNGHNQKQYKIRGPFFLSEYENANKRRYPYDLACKKLQSYIAEKVEHQSALGELEHPTSNEINLERVCHRVTNLKEDKKMWMGESLVLSGHPCGDIVASLIKNGCRFGVSSRSLGTLSEDKSVVTDFNIICFDIVANPSISKFVDGILESKQFMINDHGQAIEVAYQKLEKKLETLPQDKTARAKEILTSIDAFLKGI